jgi:hypothetical protein
MPETGLIAKAKATWRMLWDEVVGPEPDVPIPTDLQMPAHEYFDVHRALIRPTVWEALHARELLWVMELAGIEPLSTTEGLTCRRVLQVWHSTRTPEGIGLYEKVWAARNRSQLWRTHMDVLSRHLAAGDEIEELVPWGRAY